MAPTDMMAWSMMFHSQRLLCDTKATLSPALRPMAMRPRAVRSTASTNCSVEYETRLPLFGMVIMRSKGRLANWYRGKSNKRVGWLMVVNLRSERRRSVRWTGLAI